MPFTWIQDGVKIAVNPIKYELARARAIRQMYADYSEMWNAADPYRPSTIPGNDALDKLASNWLDWNKALVAHKVSGGIDTSEYIYRDRFAKFLEKLRAGQVQGKDNNAENALKQTDGFWEEAGEVAVRAVKAIPVVALGIGVVNLVSDTRKNIGRIMDYDRGTDEYDYQEGDGWWARRKKDVGKVMRKAKTLEMISQWRDYKFAGLEYGDIRNFWLDSGALDLFNNNSILGTAGAAIPLLEFLLDKGILPKGPKAEKSNAIHDLMHWFYQMAGIKGYDWKHVLGDETSQAGFA